MFYQKKGDSVQCLLCPQACLIPPNKRGLCGVRENREKKLYSLNFGKVASLNLDPIEKKPLFHFLPGSYSLSLATVGCNLSCSFCQNWEISQAYKKEKVLPGKKIMPEEIVDLALKHNCQSISYTYTEPTIFFEYAYQISRIAHQKNLKNVFVSNGFINPGPIETISPHLDAINIDLKGFSEDYYKKICQGSLQPILNAVENYYKNKIFVEITSLIVPGHNDSERMIRKMAKFIAGLDKNIPWHISAFHPCHKMKNTPSTDVETIEKAREIGRQEGIKYIYAGNRGESDNTLCPSCKKVLIERSRFAVRRINTKNNLCPECSEKTNLVLG